MDPKIGKMPQGGLHGSLIPRTRYRCASLSKQLAFDLAFFAVSASLTNSAAADTVNWRQFEGTSITWAYDIHPYADALAAQFPEFEKLTRHQGHAGTLPRRFLLEQDDDPTDDEVASMGCVRHWHSARVGPRSEWRPGAAGQIPERSEAYRCWIRLHYVDMIKKCAAPSFANDNWYQVVDGISSGRTAMTIDSNMFGFWNDVAGSRHPARSPSLRRCTHRAPRAWILTSGSGLSP